MRTYNVTVSGCVRHDGVPYAPGDMIPGMAEEDAERLERLGVVASSKVASEPVIPLGAVKADELTGEQIAFGLNARNIVEAIEGTASTLVIRDVIEREQGRERPRKTVLDAAEKRLAELGGE